MKKKYVAPESALLTLNFNENIAASSMESGGDLVSGGGVIHFTQHEDGCRGLYTGHPSAVVTNPYGTFGEHANTIISTYLFLYNVCLIF